MITLAKLFRQHILIKLLKRNKQAQHTNAEKFFISTRRLMQFLCHVSYAKDFFPSQTTPLSSAIHLFLM